MDNDPEIDSDERGISRRKILRGAVIAVGGLVWSAPVIKSAMATSVVGSCIPDGAPCGGFEYFCNREAVCCNRTSICVGVGVSEACICATPF
jgi:hypothetical protein